MQKYFTCQRCGEIHIAESKPEKCIDCDWQVLRQGLEMLPSANVCEEEVE